MLKSTIYDLVKRAAQEVSMTLPEGVEIETEPDTALFGRGAAIDSMALVSLIVAVENEMFDELDISVVLANEKAMSMERSPFRTIGSLVDYAHQVVEEAGDG